MTRTRSLLRGLALVVVATVLTGCLDVSLHTRLDADGAGTLRMELVLGEELVETFGSFGESISSEDLAQDGETDLPPEFAERTRITPLDDGVGVSVEIDFEDIDELNLLLADTDVDGAGSDGLVDRVEFEADGDQVRFSAEVGASDAFEADDEFAMFFGALAEPTVSFSVELPGTIGETNADEVDGRTATWDLVAASGTTIFAESGASTSLLDSPWLLVVVGLVGLLALVLLIIVLARLRRSSKGSEPAAASPAGPTTPAAGAPAAGAPTAPTATWGEGPTPSGPPPMTGPAPMTGAPPLTGPPPMTGPPPVAPADPQPTPPEPEPQPAPPAAPPPAGWHPDPAGSGRQRWWDGTTWTDHLH